LLNKEKEVETFFFFFYNERNGSDNMNLPNLKEAGKRSKKATSIIYKEQYKKNLSGSQKTYYVKTYGCQMNERDSETIKAILENLSFKEVDSYEKADIIILNTCSIRENAHNKVFGMLGRIKHLKTLNKNIIVGVMGCMAQEEVVAKEILKRYKWIDFVLGTHKMDELSEIIEQSIKERKLKIEAPSIEGEIIENLPVKRANQYKAYITIMYGCDKFCTYCIVPYTRGKQRSRKKEDILKEVKELQEAGYQEITLLGQNVNAYGKDCYDDYTLANLLEEIAKTKIPRIRFITSHPWDFTDDMIQIIAKYENIMPYIHLPIQSGNNEILKKMGRRYTKEEYLTLFYKLKEQIPNVAISTDIIVGFPGETDEQFEDTLKIVEECKYDLAYTFIFSKRVGTPAEKMVDPITKETKEKRLACLNEKVNQYALEANQKLIGKIVPVLLEQVSEKSSNELMGYTDTSKLINVKADKKYLGKIVNVKVTEAKTWSLNGEIVTENKVIA